MQEYNILPLQQFRREMAIVKGAAFGRKNVKHSELLNYLYNSEIHEIINPSSADIYVRDEEPAK